MNMDIKTISGLKEYQLIRHCLTSCRKDIIIFEIGCRNGNLTARYGAHTHGQLKAFYSFEPDPRGIKEIRANKKFPRYAELVPKAISSKNGMAKFHCSSGHNSYNKHEYRGASSLLDPKDVLIRFPFINFNQVEVETITLDTFCAQRKVDHIDMIIADMQGGERNMIIGAKRMLPHIKFIFMEKSEKLELYDGQWLAPDMIKDMAAKGFKVMKQFTWDMMFYNTGLVKLA